MSKLLSPEDRRFLRKGMKYFGIRMLKLEFSDSKKTYPDIWISLDGQMPKITVTREWMKQNSANRQSRLTHELLHKAGLEHNEKIGYNSHPEADSFSKKVYLDIIKGSSKFDRRKFGL